MGAKGSCDIAPEIRGGLKRALLILEERKRPLSTIWVELFESDPATALKLAISLMPKDVAIDLTTHTIEDFVTTIVSTQTSADSKPKLQ